MSNLLPAQRILVIRYRFIGDTILTVPFLRNLREAYPHAVIDVLVGPQSGEVLQGCPYVNELITYDTTRFHKYDRGDGKRKNFFYYATLLKKRGYDMAFVLKRSWSSAFLALLSGARYRIGYATEGRQVLLTHHVPFRSDIHEVDSTLEVLKAANIPVGNRELEAWVSEEEDASVREVVAGIDPDIDLANPEKSRLPVLIHAAAAHPDKVYPLESWAKVIKSLNQKTGCIAFFTGAEQDRETYDVLGGLAEVKTVNLAGKLSLRQSMALYKRMKISICVDSGPAHLSAAVGTPTLTIFGPTDPIRWGPIGGEHKALFDEQLFCRPCLYDKSCQQRECLTELAPESVVKAAMERLRALRAVGR